MLAYYIQLVVVPFSDKLAELSAGSEDKPGADQEKAAGSKQDGGEESEEEEDDDLIGN